MKLKRNWLIIGGVVIAVLVIAAIFGLRQMNASASAATVRAQTATVTRGNLVATVSASGNVSAPEDAVMGFQTSGRIAKVNVQVGDLVKRGQVLMELDTADLELSLKSAKASLSNQQASFEQTKANLDFALRNAQATLTSSQANLDAAKAKNAQNPSQLLAAKASLEKATVALQKAQSDYNAVAWRPDVGMTPQAQTLASATSDYQSALANYNVTVAGINDSALKSAQAQFDRDTVSLQQAQKNLDTQLRTAQAQLDSSQVAYEQAQRNLEKARITAPFDGAVAAINFSVGDSAGTGNAVTVVDMNNLQIKVTVAEVDISKIKVGQTAQLSFDALSGKTYSAKVLAIGPVATVTQGVVNYPVTVSITNSDGSVKPGMTANLNITVEERTNVLLVPLRAVRTQGNQKTVTVLYQGQNIAVPVTTGLTNDQYAEVVSQGLKEGDELVLTTTTTRQTTGGGGIPGGGVPGAGAIFGGR